MWLRLLAVMWQSPPATTHDLAARVGAPHPDGVRHLLRLLHDRGVVRKAGKVPGAHHKPRILWELQPVGELFGLPDSLS